MAGRISLSLVLVGLWSLSSCDASDPSATSSPGSQASNTPVIASIAVQSQGNGIFNLQAIASDPNGSPLAYKWGVSGGTLLSNSQAAVQWKAPTAAGTIVASLQATDPTGLSASASQPIAVSANGQTANSVGTIQNTTGSTLNADGTVNTSGQSTVPSPASGAVGQPDSGGLTAPFLAPAVSLPNSFPSPAPAILQPVSTPKPVPSPSPLPPSPIPTAIPPTPQPGVPIPPPLRWFQYDPTKVPVSTPLSALDFQTPDDGWVGGTNGVVMNFHRGTPGVDPTLTLMNTGVPPTSQITHIHFESTTAGTSQEGFISGQPGLVMRTLNGGTLWDDITPLAANGLKSVRDIAGLAVVNDQIVYAAADDGTVWKTESAREDPAAVNWQIVRAPNTNHDIGSSLIVAATTFPTQPTVVYLAGDEVYKLDTDPAVPAASQWKKILTFKVGATSSAADTDGTATDMKQVSEKELWVSTSNGNLYRTLDGGDHWTPMDADRYYNREFDGNGTFLLDPIHIYSLSVPDSSNGFLSTESSKVYDTRDATLTWRALPADNFAAMQIMGVTTAGVRDFTGFGVTLRGALWIYRAGL